MSSAQSSESADHEFKTEFLKKTIDELAVYIPPCEAWLTTQRRAVPDLESKNYH